jgi:tRNA pseudouridine38/39 synthase
MDRIGEDKSEIMYRKHVTNALAAQDGKDNEHSIDKHSTNATDSHDINVKGADGQLSAVLSHVSDNTQHEQNQVHDSTIQASSTKSNSLSSASKSGSSEEKSIQRSDGSTKRRKKHNPDVGINWNTCGLRHVALKFMYNGALFSGFSLNDIDENSVEHHIFAALVKARLIENKDSCAYARCGRTDKGVSALGQVVSLYIRSKFTNQEGQNKVGWVKRNLSDEFANVSDDVCPNSSEVKSKNIDDSNEIDYCRCLNRILPPGITVISSAFVPLDFSARFSCTARVYKYFFFAETMNIEKMHEAGQLLKGCHDFRNLCKMDVVNASHFERNIRAVEVKVCRYGQNDQTKRCILTGSNIAHFQSEHHSDSINHIDAKTASSSLSRDDLCEITVVGEAFLYHQIRCIIAILFLVGLGHEKPSIIQELLDVKSNPRKPNYVMASDAPLVLWDCVFPSFVQWSSSQINSESCIGQLHQLWRHKTIDMHLHNMFWRTFVPPLRQYYIPAPASYISTIAPATSAAIQHPHQSLHDQSTRSYNIFPVPFCDSAHTLLPLSATSAHQAGDGWTNTGPSTKSNVKNEQKTGESATSQSEGGESNVIDVMTVTESFQPILETDQQKLMPLLTGLQLERHLNTAYTPLMARQKEKSYEEKVTNLKGKKLERKIINNEFLQFVNEEMKHQRGADGQPITASEATASHSMPQSPSQLQDASKRRKCE